VEVTMSTMRILTAGLLAVTLAVASGCKKPDEAPAKAPPAPADEGPITPAGAAAPLTFENKTAAAEVNLKLAPELARQPDLHARLYSEGVANLRQFAEGAANERAELGDGEGSQMPPYSREVDWSVGAETGKLLGAWSLQAEYTGGAHGNASFNSVLWDKALKRTIPASMLFGPGVDDAMNKALCDALTAEKKRRLGDTYMEPGPDSWTCPKWRDTVFTLAPSNNAGKAGGLVFLIAPYMAGAYAEGDYRIAVPSSTFARYLKPAYADEFAGSPRLPPELLAAQP